MNCINLFSLLQNGFTVYPHPPCNATWLSSCEQDNSLFPTLTFNCLLTVSSGKCKDVSTVGDRDKLMIWISLSSLKNLEPPPLFYLEVKVKENKVWNQLQEQCISCRGGGLTIIWRFTAAVCTLLKSFNQTQFDLKIWKQQQPQKNSISSSLPLWLGRYD